MSQILLIEDDEQLASILIRFLNAEGYATSHANGQREGLRLFEENRYDCVLLDISLKDGNGYSVCAAIKKQSDTPVIFITASADEACTVAGFEMGADDYIGKPFGTRELLARMKTPCASTKNTRPCSNAARSRSTPSRDLCSKTGGSSACPRWNIACCWCLSPTKIKCSPGTGSRRSSG